VGIFLKVPSGHNNPFFFQRYVTFPSWHTPSIQQVCPSTASFRSHMSHPYIVYLNNTAGHDVGFTLYYRFVSYTYVSHSCESFQHHVWVLDSGPASCVFATRFKVASTNLLLWLVEFTLVAVSDLGRKHLPLITTLTESLDIIQSVTHTPS
jgi:hypothetical protein